MLRAGNAICGGPKSKYYPPAVVNYSDLKIVTFDNTGHGSGGGNMGRVVFGAAEGAVVVDAQ